MRIFLLLTFMLLAPFTAHAGLIDIQEVATGDNVEITGGATGRIFAAGWKINIGEGDYTHTMLLTGANVNVDANASGPVYIFGQNISIDGTYTGPVAAAGQDIRLEPSSSVEDDLWLSGQTVWLKGKLPASGKVLGNRVIIDGNILPVNDEDGDEKFLDIQAQELELTENAVIGGRIIYRSKTMPRVSSGAQVLREIQIEDSTFEDELKAKMKKVAWLGKLGSVLMLLVWLLIAGLVVSLVMAPKMRSSLKRVREHPARMMGAGVGYMLAIPVIAVVLFVTVVGMPVAISLLAGYPIAIIMGFSIGTLWIGTLIYEAVFKKVPYRRHQYVGCYLIGMVIVLLITRIPYVGFIGWLFPLAGGLGAFSWLKWKQMQAGKE